MLTGLRIGSYIYIRMNPFSGDYDLIGMSYYKMRKKSAKPVGRLFASGKDDFKAKRCDLNLD